MFVVACEQHRCPGGAPRRHSVLVKCAPTHSPGVLANPRSAHVHLEAKALTLHEQAHAPSVGRLDAFALTSLLLRMGLMVDRTGATMADPRCLTHSSAPENTI